jgi:UV DNA damage endonuclease
LIDAIKSLPVNVRQRLTLENDESAYNVQQLSHVFAETNTPIVFDSHHHVFNDGDMSMDDAMNVARQTWSGMIPLQHLSNTEPEHVNGSFTDRRKHSNFIHYVPDCQLAAIRDRTAVVEVEAKMKNVSIFKMVKDFNLETTC